MSDLITDPYKVPVTFCTALAGIGVLNQVVNITFGTHFFTPNGNIVMDDVVISSRLRLDLGCAQALYEKLGEILAQAKIMSASTETAH